jgi:hypothetical protein
MTKIGFVRDKRADGKPVRNLTCMKKNRTCVMNQETTFSKLLGQPSASRDEPPSCAGKMGIEDGYIFCQLRVYTKHKLVYEFAKGGIYEKFFGRKSYHRAGRQFEHYLGILRDVMSEQFLAALEKTFGWVLQRGRTRQTHLIFLLPGCSEKEGPMSAAEPEVKAGPEDFCI